MDTVVMDESRGRTDFVDSISNLGSTIQINSIAIDITSSMEAIEPPLVHDHFSIRGFAAGMRKKDWKTCFPFASVGNDIEPEGNLPPLSVPEFRWWQSSNCIPNAEMKRTTEEMVVEAKGDTSGSSCKFVGGKDGLFLCRRKNTDIVDERDNASPGSDGTSTVLPYKRKLKLRFLADILVEGRMQTSSNFRTRSASSCGVQVASTDMEAILVPQLEVFPSDVAKAVPSHEKKRKDSLEEDREPLAAIFPSAAVKRLKGLLLDGEKKSGRVEISMRSDLPRTKLIKPKKAKATDTRKKKGKIHRDDEIAEMREYLKFRSSTNLQEQGIHVGPWFSSSRSGQPIEKTLDLSGAKTSEVGDVDRLRPLKESISGNCSIRGKVGLDRSRDSFMDTERNDNDQAGSLREHRFIPDLNMEFPDKTAMTEEQKLTVLSEKRNSPLHKTENVREGKRRMGISERKHYNAAELGASDDIPMEIVELLARNQHERALGNSRRLFLETDNSTRVYSKVNKDEHPCTIKFPLPSRINGSTVANGNMGVKLNTSTNIPQLIRYQSDTSRPEENQFRLFSPSTPSQLRKPEYPVSISKMVRPRSGTGSESIQSSCRENVPFRLSIPQNRPIQPSDITTHSFLDQCHKGKKAVSGSIYTSIGLLDPYANDTIPAMQLLSLMDQRVKSASSFQLGKKASFDKPFSPCKHHLHLNGKENHNFHHGSLFKHSSNSKGFSWLHYGVPSYGESSERASKLRVREERNVKTTLLDQSGTFEKRSARSKEALGNCTLNKNPADFSIPQVGNIFTLTGKELEPRRRNAFKEKSPAENIDGRKKKNACSTS